MSSGNHEANGKAVNDLDDSSSSSHVVPEKAPSEPTPGSELLPKQDSPFFFEDEVFRLTKRGTVKFGLVVETPETYSGDEDEDYDDLKKGDIRVSWFPEAEDVVVRESQIGLADRSLMPGDIVRRLVPGKNTQRGFCRDINLKADLKILGTRQILRNIPSERLRAVSCWSHNTAVCLDSWVGSAKHVEEIAVLRASSGARVEVPSDRWHLFYEPNHRSHSDNQHFFVGNVVIGRVRDMSNFKKLTPDLTVPTNKKGTARFTIESINTESLYVDWQCKALSDDKNVSNNSIQQPPRQISGTELDRLKRINLYDTCLLQINDRCYIKYSKDDETIDKRAWRKDVYQKYKKLLSEQREQIQRLNESGTTAPLSNTSVLDKLRKKFNLPAENERTCKSKKSYHKIDKNKSKSSNLTNNSSIEDPDWISDGETETFTDKAENDEGEISENELNKSKETKQETPVKVNEDKPLISEVVKIGESKPNESQIEEANAELVKSEDAQTKKSELPEAKDVKTDLSKDKAADAIDKTDGGKDDGSKLGENAKPNGNLIEEIQVVEDEATIDNESKAKSIHNESIALKRIKVEGAKAKEEAVAGETKSTQENLKENKSEESIINEVNSKDGKSKPVKSQAVEGDKQSNNSVDSKNTPSSTKTAAASSSKAYLPYMSKKFYPIKKRSNTSLKKEHNLKDGEETVLETLVVYSTVNVIWQDGTLETDIPSTQLYPIHHLDSHEYFPGDYVCCTREGVNYDSNRDYGVVQKVDHLGRTAVIKWFTVYTCLDNPVPTYNGETEVSVYDLKDHPDFQFRAGAMVIRVANFVGEDEKSTAGQVVECLTDGKLKVSWVDGHVSNSWPQDIFEVAQYDTQSDEDSDDSWETETENSEIGIQSSPPKLLVSDSDFFVNIAKARDLIGKLEQLFAQENNEAVSVGVLKKLIVLYKSCRQMDRMMCTNYFHEDKFTGILERVDRNHRDNLCVTKSGCKTDPESPPTVIVELGATNDPNKNEFSPKVVFSTTSTPFKISHNNLNSSSHSAVSQVLASQKYKQISLDKEDINENDKEAQPDKSGASSSYSEENKLPTKDSVLQELKSSEDPNSNENDGIKETKYLRESRTPSKENLIKIETLSTEEPKKETKSSQKQLEESKSTESTSIPYQKSVVFADKKGSKEQLDSQEKKRSRKFDFKVESSTEEPDLLIISSKITPAQQNQKVSTEDSAETKVTTTCNIQVDTARIEENVGATQQQHRKDKTKKYQQNELLVSAVTCLEKASEKSSLKKILSDEDSGHFSRNENDLSSLTITSSNSDENSGSDKQANETKTASSCAIIIAQESRTSEICARLCKALKAQLSLCFDEMAEKLVKAQEAIETESRDSVLLESPSSTLNEEENNLKEESHQKGNEIKRRKIDWSMSEEAATETATENGSEKESGTPETCPETLKYLIANENEEGEPECQDCFEIVSTAPKTHKFYDNTTAPKSPKAFLSAVAREHHLLKTSLPTGVWVKAFEDRMDLLSVMIEGPKKTPYEDGLFFFDIQLCSDYPKSPPTVHYISFCNDRLNPNLYDDGKVCVSLLGTWSGRGTEVWTKSSTLLQLFVSIQGLILVPEPYFNEAGYEKQKGTQQGDENSRMYNEMVILKFIQATTKVILNPPILFKSVVCSHFQDKGMIMYRRFVGYMELSKEKKNNDDSALSIFEIPEFPLLPASRGFCLTLEGVLNNFYHTLVKSYIDFAKQRSDFKLDLGENGMEVDGESPISPRASLAVAEEDDVTEEDNVVEETLPAKN